MADAAWTHYKLKRVAALNNSDVTCPPLAFFKKDQQQLSSIKIK